MRQDLFQLLVAALARHHSISSSKMACCRAWHIAISRNQASKRNATLPYDRPTTLYAHRSVSVARCCLALLFRRAASPFLPSSYLTTKTIIFRRLQSIWLALLNPFFFRQSRHLSVSPSHHTLNSSSKANLRSHVLR